MRHSYEGCGEKFWLQRNSLVKADVMAAAALAGPNSRRRHAPTKPYLKRVSVDCCKTATTSADIPVYTRGRGDS
jgi:hypothetical protein